MPDQDASPMPPLPPPMLPPERRGENTPRPPCIALHGISKRFPRVLANAGIDLALWPGEVHVLLGENGAGKSTLIAMLAGFLAPDAGSIRIDGAEQRLDSPARALALGIGTVFQHPMLVPSLSVIDNIGLAGSGWSRPDRAGIARRVAALASELGIEIDMRAPVGQLAIGEQRQAEILRALIRGSRVLLLDEATAMLTPEAAAQLGALLRRLAKRDIAVLFITHRLDEALAYGDRISVLRGGRKAGEITPARLRERGAEAGEEALRLMFGSDAAMVRPAGLPPGSPRRVARPDATPVLQLVGLAIPDPAVPVRELDLAIYAGEILGLAGIDGNGQAQLAAAVSGQRRIAAGRILLDGTPIEALPVGARYRRGLRYVTDDRLGEGSVARFPLSLNLLLKQIGAPPFWRRGIERPAAIAAHAAGLIRSFDIRAPGPATPIGRLSGGNIQKALLAREFTGAARAVILAKPTHGLDVRTTRAAHERIRAAAAAGVGVLLISTDLDEILELSDRIAVLARGGIVGILANDASARRQVGALMGGLAHGH